VTTVPGTRISVILAAGRRSGNRPLRQAITAYVEVIPQHSVSVQLFLHLPSACQPLGISFDPVSAAILAMTLNGGPHYRDRRRPASTQSPRQKEAVWRWFFAARQSGLSNRCCRRLLQIFFTGAHQPGVIMMLESARRVADFRQRTHL